MTETTGAGEAARKPGSPRWWQLQEHEWYKLVMAAAALVLAVTAVTVALRNLWPNPDPPRTALSNYAILLDRSESMSSPFGETTRLRTATGELLSAVDEDEEIARALWYFGGGCDAISVDQRVELASDNISTMRSELAHPPPPRGERPLVDALVAAIRDLAAVSTSVGGDVATDRRIVIFTDGPDTCGDDPTRVTTALERSGIQVELNIVGINLDAGGVQPLQDLAQALPAAELIPADNAPAMYAAVVDAFESTELSNGGTTTTTATTTTTILTTTSPATTSGTISPTTTTAGEAESIPDAASSLLLLSCVPRRRDPGDAEVGPVRRAGHLSRNRYRGEMVLR